MGKEKQIQVIKISQIRLRKLKKDPKFILILQLCRYLNQLSFCHDAFLDNSEAQTPKGICQRTNAILFANSVLYESFKIVPSLGKEFKNYKSYKDGFKNFFKEPNVIFLKDKVLNKVRSHVVFHVLDKPIKETLETLNLPKMYFLTTTPDSVHYQLADEIALNYFIGDSHLSPDDEIEYYFETTMKILEVTKSFIGSASKLIDEYCQLKYWKLQDIDSLQ